MLCFKQEDVPSEIEVVLILSYHRTIPSDFLRHHRYNIVIHAVDPSKGKGWVPLIWQVIEGRNDIVFTLFEADSSVDNDPYYLKRTLYLQGTELNAELCELQAQMCVNMSLEFLRDFHNMTAHPQKQQGEESFYPKRSAADSEPCFDKTIREQFNLLRTVDNENYPAFFIKDDHKYLLKIYHT